MVGVRKCARVPAPYGSHDEIADSLAINPSLVTTPMLFLAFSMIRTHVIAFAQQSSVIRRNVKRNLAAFLRSRFNARDTPHLFSSLASFAPF